MVMFALVPNEEIKKLLNEMFNTRNLHSSEERMFLNCNFTSHFTVTW